MQPDFSRPVLAVDTGTSFLSLALQTDVRILSCHTDAGNKQSDLILPQIGGLFAEAGITAADLGAVVYNCGPGAFTGLRIGVGVAQGLAAPFGTPLIGIPSLDAAAYLVQGHGVLAAADARMGEVFYAWFDTVNRRRLSPYRVGRAAEISVPEGTVFSDGIGKTALFFTVRENLTTGIRRQGFQMSPGRSGITAFVSVAHAVHPYRQGITRPCLWNTDQPVCP